MPALKIVYDEFFLKKLYHESKDTLLEMAAPSYLHPNPLIRWIVNRRMQIALSYLDLGEGQTLLDFGCGAAILLLQLPRQPQTYYGVDLEIWPAQRMLEHSKRDDVVLFKGNEWLTGIPDGSLDNIAAIEVLEHVLDLPALLVSFRRKLAPGGRLVISGPTESPVYKLARRISGFSGHYHVRNIFDIQAALKEAGFRKVKTKKIPLDGIFTLFIVSQYEVRTT
jgi:2-polyprenyl-3-methyl-5-hydroxy-6-metoxy-1,4-benzoquinol methylase